MSDAVLEGQHALVTGGGSGIGAHVAQVLANCGARVTVAGRRAAPLESIARALPNGAAVVADLTQTEEVARAVERAREHHGRISILVNNAGAAVSAPIARTTREIWDGMLDSNALTAFLCTRAFLAQADPQCYGRIVNVASTAGLKGYAYVSAYCAAKHAVVGLTRALALELAQTRITVNAVCPGYTDTELLTEAMREVAARTGRTLQSVREQFLAANPQGRLVSPREVAQAVAWLCSPGAAAVNGQPISVCGGEVCA